MPAVALHQMVQDELRRALDEVAAENGVTTADLKQLPIRAATRRLHRQARNRARTRVAAQLKDEGRLDEWRAYRDSESAGLNDMRSMRGELRLLPQPIEEFEVFVEIEDDQCLAWRSRRAGHSAPTVRQAVESLLRGIERPGIEIDRDKLVVTFGESWLGAPGHVDSVVVEPVAASHGRADRHGLHNGR